MRERGGPPPWAVAWLERRLPGEVRDALIGDLAQQYRDEIRPRYGRWLAGGWFWWQALSIRSGALRRGAARLRAVRPTYERSGHLSDTDPWSWFNMRLQDVRYALRRIAQAPGFVAVAVLSLGLGIGANTAMFSVVNAALIRGLPVSDPEELVEVYTSDSDGFEHATSSHPDYLDLRSDNTVFEDVVATRTFIARMDDGGTPRVVFGELVSWDYFQALGVPMELGRSFVPEEDATPGTHPVAILGYRTWMRDFAGDARAIGRTTRLNGRAYEIVGVAPEAFSGSMPVLAAGFFVPLMMTDEIMGSEQLARRGSRSMFMKARLKEGVSVAQANAALTSFSTALAELHPDTNEHRVMSAVPSGDVALHPLVDRVLTPVAGLLLGVVGIVLLIACANLASFLLARAEDRRTEIAVRLALGAGRRDLIGQLLTESTIIALAGGVVGLALANWTLEGLLSLRPPLPVPLDLEIGLDRTVLLFTAGVSLFAGIAFGLLPALQATTPDVAPTLKNDDLSRGGARRPLVRNGLVVTQVSLSFILLIGAGLFLRSLQKAQQIDPGFDVGPAAVLWPMPELSGYDTPDEVRDFHQRLEERLLAHPLIDRVAQADRLPLGAGVQTSGYLLPGVPSETPDGDHDIDNAHVNAGYFDAMGVPLLRGRGFETADMDGEPVVIVSQAFVDRYYPGESFVGEIIQGMGGTEFRVVGVAADSKVRTLGEEPRPYVYELQGQVTFFGMQVVARGSGDSEELLAAARGVLAEVDPDVVLFEEPKTMNEHLALLLFPPRMAALLLTAFGGLALLLAGVGVYGVVNYAVSRRTREVGIRMSLGASAGDVVRMTVGGGMKLVVLGAVIGVILAGGATWAISGYLFGIGPTDVVTFVTIPALLLTVAGVAAWIPARRASTVDPVRALRAD